MEDKVTATQKSPRPESSAMHKPSRLRGLISIISKHLTARSISACPPSVESTIISANGFPKHTLQTLPLELLLEITTHLTPVDTACFLATSRFFRSSLPSIPPSILNPCVRWLITCRHERDLIPPSDLVCGVFSNPTIKRVACAFCKRSRPLNDFTGEGFKSVMMGVRQMLRGARGKGLELGQDQAQGHEAKREEKAWFPSPHLLHSAPESRICARHAPGTSWVPVPCAVHRSRPHKRYWLKWMDLTCMHCGRWVAGDDGRESGCEACGCAVCPRALQPCFERYGEMNKGVRPLLGKTPEIVGFLRRGGRVYVREVGGWRGRVVEDPMGRVGCVGTAGGDGDGGEGGGGGG